MTHDQGLEVFEGAGSQRHCVDVAYQLLWASPSCPNVMELLGQTCAYSGSNRLCIGQQARHSVLHAIDPLCAGNSVKSACPADAWCKGSMLVRSISSAK